MIRILMRALRYGIVVALAGCDLPLLVFGRRRFLEPLKSISAGFA